MKQTIRHLFLKLLLAVMIIGILGTLVVFGLSSHVKEQASKMLKLLAICGKTGWMWELSFIIKVWHRRFC